MKALTKSVVTLASLSLVLALGTACASKKKTHEELKMHEERIEKLEQDAEKTDTRVTTVEKKLDEFSETAKEALERAKELGAAGTLIDEAVLTQDVSKFRPGSAELSPEAMSFLDEFAAKLKADNKPVYIEIQGHTDGEGTPQANLKLGERRAQAVHDYLAKIGGLPLHRLKAISYGESKPLGDNKTKEGRSQNRRVVLVVLR
ncbi:MAG: OmpA family protein [bacterium]